MFSWTCCKKYFWVDCFHAVVSLWSRLCDGLAMVKTICYCTRFPPLIVEVSKGKSFGGLDYGPWRCGLDAHVSFCKCCLECPCSRGLLWAHFYWAYHLQYFWWFYLCFFFFSFLCFFFPAYRWSETGMITYLSCNIIPKIGCFLRSIESSMLTGILPIVDSWTNECSSRLF